MWGNIRSAGYTGTAGADRRRGRQKDGQTEGVRVAMAVPGTFWGCSGANLGKATGVKDVAKWTLDNPFYVMEGIPAGQTRQIGG